ncbi:hypothetical protein C8R47DRAFT_1267708 [Mycena vitilis]|nr:hypothetical protein C8R47DRAFT_1267708 [Mycena vitilis]
MSCPREPSLSLHIPRVRYNPLGGYYYLSISEYYSLQIGRQILLPRHDTNPLTRIIECACSLHHRCCGPEAQRTGPAGPQAVQSPPSSPYAGPRVKHPVGLATTDGGSSAHLLLPPLPPPLREGTLNGVPLRDGTTNDAPLPDAPPRMPLRVYVYVLVIVGVPLRRDSIDIAEPGRGVGLRLGGLSLSPFWSQSRCPRSRTAAPTPREQAARAPAMTKRNPARQPRAWVRGASSLLRAGAGRAGRAARARSQAPSCARSSSCFIASRSDTGRRQISPLPRFSGRFPPAIAALADVRRTYLLLHQPLCPCLSAEQIEDELYHRGWGKPSLTECDPAPTYGFAVVDVARRVW